MAGLIGLGQNYRQQALGGLQQVASMERNREHANDQLEQQESAAKMSAIGTGASTGAMIGMEAGMAGGGPVGAAIGAGVGLLASSIF
ncbi:MAG: bacteriocin [Spiribacter salinus]|uniref:Bacteriocin n=1 Tax=Spiribacter salinus TaxID=1335746 RepID=A0A540VPM6_9GAMM|nr:MAG: bacteriocin [Spiribacter salinus]